MKTFLVAVMILLSATIALGAECETITVADTAIGFTTATYQVPVGYTNVEAFCSLETAQIRIFWDDDTSPTSSVGIVMNAGNTFKMNNNYDMPYFRAIRTGASSGTLTCCYTFTR